ncbi:multicopper oxidase domain-containing protein [Actinosynnema sp. CA-248983]
MSTGGSVARIEFVNTTMTWHPVHIHCHSAYRAEAGMATTLGYRA